MAVSQQTIRIGLLGLGTVGTGVYKLLQRFDFIQITRIAVQDIHKSRAISDIPANLLTTDVESIIQDPNIDLIIEVMGGKEYAYSIIKQALLAKKPVVTANKVVISNYGPELFETANQQSVNLLFEAAVAGGIPIVLPLKTSLAANEIEQIAGILNGTTNYILTRMEQAGLDYPTALKEAQDKGFAEADPTADVEGHDAASKIAILASIAYGKNFSQEQVFVEGISKIGPIDIQMAETLGYAIRLIGLAKGSSDSDVDLRVHPMLVPTTHPLSKIEFENNAIWIQGDAVGDVMFYGKGAGEMPTASAIVGDVLLIANAKHEGHSRLAGIDFHIETTGTPLPMTETVNAYYIRVECEDESGVIGALGKVCGDHHVSLNAIMQKGVQSDTSLATIVLLTHAVKEADLQAAIAEIKALPTTQGVQSVLRVFEP